MLSNDIKKYINLFKHFFEKIDDIQKALGRIENRQLCQARQDSFSGHEFKVFSQTGEDGIIQFLIRNILIHNYIFVEFGVQNYTESNTRFLLQNNNWSGLVIDGSQDNVNYIKKDPIYWRYNIKAECAFIDCENINSLIIKNGVSGDVGILSVDIDGNDYWVWEAIDCITPCIVICEYNSIFGPKYKVTVPYDKKFYRTKAHYSNIYYGASISALAHLADKKGYSLVGSNRAGNNVFFVRNDLLNGLQTIKPAEAYVKAQFRESRDYDGNLTFLDFDQRVELIKELVVHDLVTGKNIKVKDLEL
jgi:hypothetical protein